MDPLSNVKEWLADFSVLESLRAIDLSGKALVKLAALFVYGIIVFCIVFISRYYVSRADELIRDVAQRNESLIIEFPYLDPQVFPPKASLDYLRIYERKGKKPILLMKDLEVRLGVLPLLVGKGNVSLAGRAYGGVVEADLTTGMFFNPEYLSVDLKFDMVELPKVPQVKAYDRSLKGFLSLEASVSGEPANPLAMEGDVYLNLAQLDMDNRFPVIKGSRLKGYRIDLDCTLEDGVMSIRDFDVKSDDGIVLKSSGSVVFDESNVQQSVLDMEGRFQGPVKRLATSILDTKAVAMLKKNQAVSLDIAGSFGAPQIVLK